MGILCFDYAVWRRLKMFNNQKKKTVLFLYSLSIVGANYRDFRARKTAKKKEFENSKKSFPEGALTPDQ